MSAGGGGFVGRATGSVQERSRAGWTVRGVALLVCVAVSSCCGGSLAAQELDDPAEGSPVPLDSADVSALRQSLQAAAEPWLVSWGFDFRITLELRVGPEGRVLDSRVLRSTAPSPAIRAVRRVVKGHRLPIPHGAPGNGSRLVRWQIYFKAPTP